MRKKSFDILDYTTKGDVLAILNRLGAQDLQPTGHGYEIYGQIPIREASDRATLNFTDVWQAKPAIGLIMVVLAANREYNVVVRPNLEKIQREEPELKTFDQLSRLVATKTEEQFYNFWGHSDLKKYTTLKNILSKVEILRRKYPDAKDDFELMNKWGNNADVLTYEDDVIGCLPNVAVATFQHLRMVFGVDTVKPDQRVKEVLDFEFGIAKLADKKVVKAVEQIAEIADIKVITVDQILVKYGSSYYNRKINKITLKQIVKNLKALGVDDKIISKATNLSVGQVERL